jgi:hypothetical protein
MRKNKPELSRSSAARPSSWPWIEAVRHRRLGTTPSRTMQGCSLSLPYSTTMMTGTWRWASRNQIIRLATNLPGGANHHPCNAEDDEPFRLSPLPSRPARGSSIAPRATPLHFSSSPPRPARKGSTLARLCTTGWPTTTTLFREAASYPSAHRSNLRSNNAKRKNPRNHGF